MIIHKISLVLLILLVLGSCSRVQYDDENDFTIEPLEDGVSAEITDYVGGKQDVRIPPSIQGLTVTTIGPDSFREKDLNSVTIPNTVTMIRYGAFLGNHLESLVIPNSVTGIGVFAFMGNQLTSVSIPNSVTAIGQMAFYQNQLTSVTIPNQVSVIQPRTFGSNRLTSVVIPDSVRNIHHMAFSFSNNLSSVRIGANVTIDDSADDPVFPLNFLFFYHSQGSRAGTYTLNDGSWSAQFR